MSDVPSESWESVAEQCLLFSDNNMEVTQDVEWNKAEEEVFSQIDQFFGKVKKMALSDSPVKDRVERYLCARCTKEICGKEKLQKHEVKCSMIIRCSVCFKAFAQPDILESHQKSHPNVKVHSCITCGKKFYSELGFVEHLCFGKTLNPNFICRYCSRMLIDKNVMEVHEAQHFQYSTKLCFGCLTPCSGPIELYEHWKQHERDGDLESENEDSIHDEKGDKAIGTTMSEKEVEKSDVWKWDQLVDAMIEIVHCPHCYKSGNVDKNKFEISIVPHTDDEGLHHVLKCKLCPELIICAVNCANHVLSHCPNAYAKLKPIRKPLIDCTIAFDIHSLFTLIRKYKSEECIFCRKIFTSSVLVEQHIRSEHVKYLETGRCPSDPFCTDKFASVAPLLSHIFKKHNLTKPKICSLCKYKFTVHQSMTPLRHYIRHFDTQSDYKCKGCKGEFKDRKIIIDHLDMNCDCAKVYLVL